MPTFKDWVTQTLAPIWLRGTWGARFLGVIGEAADRIADYTKDAVKAAHPGTCPDDALSYNGAGRNIERYTAETDSGYRTKITDPWSVWEISGSYNSLVARLNEQGFSSVTIYPWAQLQPYVPDRWANWPSAFWVWIGNPNPVELDGLWGSAGEWGDIVPSPITGAPPGPGVWGCSLTTYQVREMRAAVRKWKQAHEICAEFNILVGTERWEPDTPWQNGTWGDSVIVRISGV